MNRIRIKETAKDLLKKNHWLCVGVMLIVSLLGGAVTGVSTSFNFTTNTNTGDPAFWQGGFEDEAMLPFILIFLVIFILALISGFAIKAFVGSQVKVGSCRFFLKYRKNHPVEIGELFKSYTDKTFINVAKVSIIKDLSIFLWTMLCIIPGIIKTYEYAAVDYILSVNPSMDYKRAFELSRKIMQGHKLELFELYISFLGWHILSVFTCGLLSILYISPYMAIAEAEFFAYVREIAIFNGVISYNDIPDYEEYNPQPPVYQGFVPNGNFYGQPANVDYTPVQPTENAFAPAQPVEPIISVSDTQTAPPAEASVDAPADEPVVQEVAEIEAVAETTDNTVPPEENDSQTE